MIQGYYLRKYIRTLRYLEYYMNTSDNKWHKLLAVVYKIKLKRLSHITKIELYPNKVGKGLTLFHITGDKQGAVPHAVIGEHVILRPGTVLGYNGDSMRENLKSPKVGDYVEFSWGVKVFGNIKIGRGALLNANCVPLSNVPPYAIVAGNPAKVIGFTKTPEEAHQFEVERYPDSEWTPVDVLEKNYEKYFSSKLKDIKSFVKM